MSLPPDFECLIDKRVKPMPEQPVRLNGAVMLRQGLAYRRGVNMVSLYARGGKWNMISGTYGRGFLKEVAVSRVHVLIPGGRRLTEEEAEQVGRSMAVRLALQYDITYYLH